MRKKNRKHANASRYHAVKGRDGDRRPSLWKSFCARVPNSLRGNDLEQRRQLCRVHWDWFAALAVQLLAAGRRSFEIADYLGMSNVEDVMPVLRHRQVVREVAEFEGLPVAPKLLKDAYDQVVRRHLLCHLMAIFGLAALTAKQEGFPELEKTLSGIQCMRADEAKALPAFVCPPSQAKSWWPAFVRISAAACQDAAFAIGKEQDQAKIIRPLILDGMRTEAADGLGGETVKPESHTTADIPSVAEGNDQEERPSGGDA